MKNLSVLIITLVMALPASVFADEGMWFLMHLERMNQRNLTSCLSKNEELDTLKWKSGFNDQWPVERVYAI